MAKARRRRVASFSLASETHDALRAADNASEYLDRLLQWFPPPAVTTLDELATLIRSRHPWAVDPATRRARSSLPTFGGDVPARSTGAASWDDSRVVSFSGRVYTREQWEGGQ